MTTAPESNHSKAFIGTSGWNYKHWMNGVFYPHGLKPDAWLRYYSQFFSTVDVNNTFYGLPNQNVFERWRSTSPPGFVFSLKASRFYTHIKRLADPETSMGKFFENASGLGDKIGVILFQLPPRWEYDPERLKIMLDYLDNQKIIPNLRSALEIRDESWYNPECFELLRQHNVSLVLADQPGFAAEGPLTASFVFVRRHGPGAMYASNYPEESLQADARKIKTWMGEGKDVYIYFNNDLGGYAVRNAMRLKELVGF
jgi:uncharacterized protein YecE (DUF72 family)